MSYLGRNFLAMFFGLLPVASQPALAIPITLDFSFHDFVTGDSFSGVVEGLEDNGGAQAATSVVVTSSSFGYGVGEYVGNPAYNLWYLINGQIALVDFVSLGANNSLPAVECCSLSLRKLGFDSEGGLSNSPDGVATTFNNILTFTPRDTVVPLPQTLLLFTASLATLGAIRGKPVPRLQAAATPAA